MKRDARKLGNDVDEELSSDNHKVFKHRQSGKGVIAYRGTDPSNYDDLYADKVSSSKLTKDFNVVKIGHRYG